MGCIENNFSYVHGTSEKSLFGLTVGEALNRSVNHWPERDALVVPYQDVRWTYKTLNEKTDELAAGLIKLGLVPGDRVGIWSPNNSEWVLTQFATAKAGLILVNINPAYRAPELEFALQKVGCGMLITAPSHKTSNYIEMLYELIPELRKSKPGQLHTDKFPELRHVVNLGIDEFRGMLRFQDISLTLNKIRAQELEIVGSKLQFDDPINIQFTSGTTGRPKAATLTHHNIVNNAYFTGLRMNLSHNDRLIIPVPMYHCFGMVLGTLCCVMQGATSIFSSPGFDPRSVLETVQSEHCTAIHGVPTMFIAILDSPEFSKFDLKSLRTGIMAGAPCPEELMNRVIGEMNLTEITIAYGMTETGPVSFQTSVDDSLERRVTTVGSALPHTEIKIVDDLGKVVSFNTPGELLTRGYCVMPYYWNDPEKTEKAIDKSRWIASGDIATLDESGYCQIVGRIKDMLIRGGENIFPREIEEFLYTHPKIEEVEIIGVPDDKFGEEVCAWIKLRPGKSATEAEIRAYCKNKIAHFKIPEIIKFVEAFPMTVTGKVQKYVMREQMVKEMQQRARENAHD